MNKFFALAVVALTLTACNSTGGAVGGLLGAGASGYGCARLGKHMSQNARLAATAGCAVVGGVAGAYVGEGVQGGNRALNAPQQPQPQQMYGNPGGYPNQQGPNVIVIDRGSRGRTPDCVELESGTVVCQDANTNGLRGLYRRN